MEPMQDRTETNIGEYIAVLRRRWMVIAGTMILVVAIVAALDFSKTPIYEASSQLLLQPKQSESIFSPAQSSVDPTRAVQNELKIINSLAVRTAVAKAYGEKISISAVSGGDDDVIILSATDSNPKDAARKVNVYAETYQTERFNAIVDDLTQSKLVLQQQIDDFQKEIDSINQPLAALDEKLAATPTTDPTYADLSAERERLDQQIQVRRADMENQLSDYQQRLQVLQLSERLTTTGGVQILNPATVPSSPISPNIFRDLVQAALIGFFLGVGLALLLEQVDDSIRSPGDLERATKGIPTLGLIPLDDGWKNKDEPRLTTLAAPMSATAEAYRGLRTTLQYLALHRPMGIVQITSASAHEGKTSTMANLAIAFAEAGMPVAVVGCDLRRPRAHSFLEVDGAIGLTSVLLGEVPLEVALQQSPVHPNIRVLPSGPRPPNPSELLSLDRTSELIQSLLDNHSIVFLDCPPVLPVTDSLVLSRCVDASLFIAKANSTSKREVKRSLERLTQVNNPLVGTILNGVDAEGAYGSLYDYYGYSKESRSRFLPKLFKRSVPDVPKLDQAVLPGMESDGSTPAGQFGNDQNDGDQVSGPAPLSS